MSGQIYIITGDVETGKTRWLQSAINFLNSEGKVVAGVITPGIWKDCNKLGIDAILLPSSEKINLATRNEMNDGFSKKWEFNDSSMKKINKHFILLPNFDYLVVDELGPLELERGEGLTNAIELLKSDEYKKALVVVRPYLVEKAKEIFKYHEIITIDNLRSENFSFLL